METRLDELRASYRATKDATSKKARADQKATLQGALVLNESLAEQIRREARPHGRLPGQVAQRRAAVPGAVERVGVATGLKRMPTLVLWPLTRTWRSASGPWWPHDPA